MLAFLVTRIRGPIDAAALQALQNSPRAEQTHAANTRVQHSSLVGPDVAGAHPTLMLAQLASIEPNVQVDEGADGDDCRLNFGHHGNVGTFYRRSSSRQRLALESKLSDVTAA